MKPRVLYVINSLEMGGAEAGFANLVSEGLFEGIELRIATIWQSSSDFVEAHPQLRPGLLPPLSSIQKRTPLALVSALAALKRVMAEFKPHVMVASLPQSVTIARIARMGRRSPRVISFEHSERLRSKLATLLFRLTTHLSDGVWADSESTLRAAFARHGYPKTTPSCVVPLQALAHLAQCPSPPADDSVLRMLFVGRLNSVKNLDNVLRALKLLQQDGIPACLEVFGDGPERQRLEELRNALQLEGSVVFHGQDHRWAERVRDTLRVGLVVSHREGASLAAQQIMALGHPLLATRVGAIPSFLDPHSGWIAEGWNAHQLYEAMKAAWAARQSWAEFGQRGRRQIIALEARTRAFCWPIAKAMLSHEI